MAKFVLIHGMFHGAWCWDRLLPALETRGHSALVPNLAGCAGDPTPPAECTLERWASDVTRLIHTQDEQVILVGHSRGGLVASQVAEDAAEQVAASVYLTAVYLPDGVAMATMAQAMTEAGLNSQAEGDVPFPVRFSEDGAWMLPPDADTWFHEGYSDDDRAWSAAHVAPEPSAPLGSTLHLTAGRYGKVPRFYIETLQDKILPISAQRAMIALTGPATLYTLDTGHMPTVTHVEEPAAMLDHIVQTVEA